MVRKVQTAAEKLRSLTEEKEEIEGDWCSFDLLSPPLFTGKYFDHCFIKMLIFFFNLKS